jgi:flagellar protein FlbD
MIVVSRLNGSTIVLNAELIKMIEAVPDTRITLVTGDHYIVRESVEELVKRCVAHGRSIRAFAV